MTILSAQQISIRLGEKTICHELSLTLMVGETWGILGPNGSGKTTLLHALAGLLPVTAGNIYLNAQAINRLPVKTIAQSIGILFQDINTAFPQTVWDYCLAGRYPHLPYYKKANHQDHAIAIQALTQMELNHLPHRCITQLSGGEKRRLAIAALLTQSPHFYLLDEPNNHLDVRHQMAILQFLQAQVAQKKVGVMMSLHDVNLAQRFCDRVLLLFANGEIIHGPSHEMLTVEHLSKLYQHNMHPVPHGAFTYWMPEC